MERDKKGEGKRAEKALTSGSMAIDAPRTLDAPQAALVKTIWLGNLMVFALMGTAAFLTVSAHTALSVIIGGLVALANFWLLERTIKKALLGGGGSGLMVVVLLKNAFRFVATAFVLWLLVRQGLAEPLGLLAGLSVVVVSIMTFGLIQARKLIKEGL